MNVRVLNPGKIHGLDYCGKLCAIRPIEDRNTSAKCLAHSVWLAAVDHDVSV